MRRGWGVTGHTEAEEVEVSAATLRKQKQREEDEKAGIEEITVRLGPAELAMLAEGMRERGGLDGPYTRVEYIATLLRRDNELLRQQRGEVQGRICENCRKPLPRGCGGTWRREGLCLVAQVDRALKL